MLKEDESKAKMLTTDHQDVPISIFFIKDLSFRERAESIGTERFCAKRSQTIVKTKDPEGPYCTYQRKFKKNHERKLFIKQMKRGK